MAIWRRRDAADSSSEVCGGGSGGRVTMAAVATGPRFKTGGT